MRSQVSWIPFGTLFRSLRLMVLNNNDNRQTNSTHQINKFLRWAWIEPLSIFVNCESLVHLSKVYSNFLLRLFKRSTCTTWPTQYSPSVDRPLYKIDQWCNHRESWTKRKLTWLLYVCLIIQQYLKLLLNSLFLI